MGKYNTREEFIEALKPSAQSTYEQYGIYPSVMIAQALIAAGWQMDTDCSSKDNNLFGIKYDGNHSDSLTITEGTEANDGGVYAHYQSVAESITDYGYFLKNNKRYASIFTSSTALEQADVLANAGYATDASYGALLKQLIGELKDLDASSSTSSGGSSGSNSSSSGGSSSAVPSTSRPNPPESTEIVESDLPTWTDDTYTPHEWESDLSKVTNVSKNKKMSYTNANVQQATTSDINDITDLTEKYVNTRHFENAPPGYYDYITYPHRESAYQLADETQSVQVASSGKSRTGSSNDVAEPGATGDINRVFRLGDCYFIIPPEFITVSTKTTKSEIQGIRQSGSVQVKNGYSRKEIQVSLMLNGISQINGYEVESPFSYKYAVDGLRNVIAQLKYTPFVPIENAMINLIHGVYNVAVRSINVETVPGFPEALQVSISMQEFNVTPYTRTPNGLFNDAIDWDLFRYYTQKPLVDEKFPESLKKISTKELTADFAFSVLTQDAITKAYDGTSGDEEAQSHKDYAAHSQSIGDYNLYVNVYKKENYQEFINSNDSLVLTHLSFSMGNIMPLIQLSDHESPTMQYLGATDTEFTFGFETTDSSVAARFNDMNRENQSLVRANRFKNGIGFLKIENELVQLTGTEFVIMNDINVSTIPGFPGTYSITVNCTSYDSAQKEQEKLIGMKPFGKDENGKWIDGTRDDLIHMESYGVANKILQDCQIQRSFQELELYPDLHLPTYAEIDEAIAKIRTFRTKNNLIENLQYEKYPRHTCIIPGSIEESKYEGYLDPDFYVTSLFSLSDLKVSDAKNDTIDEIYSKGAAIDEALYKSDGSMLRANLSTITAMSSKLSEIENPADLFAKPTLVPNVATEPGTAYGYEDVLKGNIHKGFLAEGLGSVNAGEATGTVVGGGNGTSIMGSSADPTQINKKTGIAFIDFMCDRADAGCGYCWSATGQILTEDKLNNYFIPTHGRGKFISDSFDVRIWMGKQVFDCSGFISWALEKAGISNVRYGSADFGSLGTQVSQSNLEIGDILYSSTHCGVYIGGGQTVEAAGTSQGVKYKTSANRFSNAVRITDLATKNTTFLTANPQIYGNNTGTEGANSSTVSGAQSTIADLNAEKLYEKAAQKAKENATTTTTTTTAGAGAPTLGKIPVGTDGDACNDWDHFTLAVCAKYNFDPNWIKAFMWVESRGNPNDPSTEGALGLMQIIPNHWPQFDAQKLYDPEYCIDAACKIFATYEQGQKWGWNKEKVIYAYYQGCGAAANHFIKGGAYIEAVRPYIANWDKIYAVLMANGGNPGSTITLLNGDGSSDAVPSAGATGTQGEAGEGLVSVETAQPYDYNKFNYDESTFKNPNAGSTHGDKISNIDMAKFGKDFIEKVAKIDDHKRFKFKSSTISAETKIANDPDHIIEYMFVDQVQYSMKGLLVRAFPSYLMVIIDEQADWVDNKKLWSNYYVTRAAVDINIHEAYDSPINTATATLTNFYSNLTHLKVSPTLSSSFDDWSLRKLVYNLTGTIIDEKITNKMIEWKNELYEDITLQEGARVHIRLGYGSNPARYPTSFNGSIVQIESGETVTFVAQSDGSELVNMPLTDKSGTTNKDLKLDEEVSDIITNMLISRENNFLYAVSKGFFKNKSRYGIEHFGMHLDLVDAGTGRLEQLTSGQNYKQYDLIKNVYKGNYQGVPYCRHPFNKFDDEYNFRFSCAGKTVWDVVKMCEKAVPEFIGYPRYFNFEQRLFYGLPSWLYKYKYNMDDTTLYEQAKSFAQVHTASSLDSIIENDIKLDTRNLATNMIGIYTLGSDLASTPVIMSDKDIDWSKQKTKTIDTTSIQDFSMIPSIVDKFISWTGSFDNGKQLAIMCCVSELMNSWKETYSGNLLLLGQPEIHPYDYVYMDDTFLGMSGLITVREVIHSMSVGTGFTTNIVPGLVANNTLKQSGMPNVISTIAVRAKQLTQLAALVNVSCLIFTRGERGFQAARTAAYIGRLGKNFLNGKGKTAFNLVKSAKIITKGADYAKEIKTLASTFSKVKSLIRVFEVGKTAVTAVVGVVFPPSVLISIAADVLLNIALTWLYDMFAYDNCINLNPLVTKDSKGNMTYFIGNKTGQKTLLPGISSIQNSDGESESDEENESDDY